jgi:hypothetical protein
MYARANESRANKTRTQNEASGSFSRPSPPAHDPTTHFLLELQRTIGNQATARLLRARLEGDPTIQSAFRGGTHSSGTPLGIGVPDDTYEQEADHVAAQATRKTEAQPVRPDAAPEEAARLKAQPDVPHLHPQKKRAQAGAESNDAVPSIVHEVLNQPGRPLDASTRAFMESRFGHDFSEVRVHADNRSEESAKQIGALAYTVGKDIVFRKGQYSPDTLEGRRLLAHELTHVVQQSADEASGWIQRQVRRPEFRPTGVGWDYVPIKGMGFVELEPRSSEEISADPKADMKGRALAGLNLASTRARMNTLAFANVVVRACEHFEEYAKPKVVALAGKLTVADLLVPLASEVLAIVAGKLTGGIASPVLKPLAYYLTTKARAQITNAASSAGSSKDDAATLAAAIEALTTGAKEATASLEREGVEELDLVINDIVGKLNSGQPLSDLETAFMTKFYMAGPGHVDEILQEEVGIPSASTAKKNELEIFRRLVMVFEYRYLMATAFSEEFVKEYTSTMSGVETPFASAARERAASETERRRREMEGQ